MQTVFIRHNFGLHKKELLDYLWENHFIAIHYEDQESTNPEDYGSAGKNALKRLWRYCESGAIIGASYSDLERNKMLIGEIEKGSTIKLLHCDTISKEYSYIFKVVKIKNPKIISFRDYPLLSAIRPKLGTITGWPSAENCLSAILGLKKLDRNVSSLAPSQLEVICYEYLREIGILKALLLPIGRTLMDIDIFGIGENGESVIAQVTHSENEKAIREKFARLKNYKNQNARLFFFGPQKCQMTDPDICYKAIEEVFVSLSKDESSIYYKMVSQMLQLPK